MMRKCKEMKKLAKQIESAMRGIKPELETPAAKDLESIALELSIMI